MEELDFEVNDREDDGIMDHLLIGREANEKKVWWQKKEIENNQGVKDDALELPPFTFQISTLYLFAVVLQRLLAPKCSYYDASTYSY